VDGRVLTLKKAFITFLLEAENGRASAKSYRASDQPRNLERENSPKSGRNQQVTEHRTLRTSRKIKRRPTEVNGKPEQET